MNGFVSSDAGSVVVGMDSMAADSMASSKMCVRAISSVAEPYVCRFQKDTRALGLWYDIGDKVDAPFDDILFDEIVHLETHVVILDTRYVVFVHVFPVACGR